MRNCTQLGERFLFSLQSVNASYMSPHGFAHKILEIATGDDPFVAVLVRAGDDALTAVTPDRVLRKGEQFLETNVTKVTNLVDLFVIE